MKEVINEYFEWLLKTITEGDSSLLKGYSKCLKVLFETEFICTLDMDENRIYDGLDLRAEFEEEAGLYLDSLGPCTVLEMMIALSLRCEGQIMTDVYDGGAFKWFWGMFRTIGLMSYPDCDFSYSAVSGAIKRFLERGYSSDGDGGLFYIPNTSHDLRQEEIWYQMHLYLDYLEGDIYYV